MTLSSIDSLLSCCPGLICCSCLSCPSLFLCFPFTWSSPTNPSFLTSYFIQVPCNKELENSAHSQSYSRFLLSLPGPFYSFFFLINTPQKLCQYLGRWRCVLGREAFKIRMKICGGFFAQDFTYAISSQGIIY